MKLLSLIMSVLLCFVLAGCGGDKNTETGVVQIVDDNQRTVTLKHVPQRMVVLSPSFLELVQALDGTVVGRAKTQIGRVPDFAKNADEVGYIFNINVEKIISLKPDLVVAYKGMHERYIDILESNNIPVVVLSLKSYDDVKHSLVTLGKIMGKEENGRQAANKLDADIKSTVDKLPKDTRTVAILHSTNMGVTMEKDTSIAGCCAKLLHLRNIISGPTKAVAGPMGSQPDMAPYSLENLVEQNPEIIFITSMGEKADIENKLRSEAMDNPAWQSIKAVRNKQVFYLPDELFLLNPGLRYTEAVRYMAAKLYPDIVKE